MAINVALLGQEEMRIHKNILFTLYQRATKTTAKKRQRSALGTESVSIKKKVAGKISS